MFKIKKRIFKVFVLNFDYNKVEGEQEIINKILEHYEIDPIDVISIVPPVYKDSNVLKAMGRIYVRREVNE